MARAMGHNGGRASWIHSRAGPKICLLHDDISFVLKGTPFKVGNQSFICEKADLVMFHVNPNGMGIIFIGVGGINAMEPCLIEATKLVKVNPYFRRSPLIDKDTLVDTSEHQVTAFRNTPGIRFPEI